ncbi:EamA-like transporter family protein [Pseudodesulfovibrio hydrargyri]|uniref:EamA-like transporter family protein n=1 Tax=Pseudodesulfovibrio hydrargyri TaxID=2125990 RepID=A0A1J5N486_9BACT|nr:DMT family transporter [Pseudodesulfovibrio hydrargyri]OIQ49640.1 EamA-like transporter family protein [Pseudodesulfovibrio hydrargyri]
MSEKSKAILLMAATALIWSSGGLAIKLVQWNPMAITGVRSALAAATLAMLFRGRLTFRFNRVQWAAALGYAGLLVTNVVATKLTTSANAILLAYTAPVYVALLAPWLLGERTRPSDWAFIAVTVGGMALFFLDRLSATGLWGNVVAVGTGLSYAVFTLCMRSQKDASPVESVILGHGLTALAGLPFMFTAPPPAEAWLGLLYLGVLQQGVSLALYVWAIKRLGALEAILIMMLEPIFNPVLVAVGYGEMPGPWAVAGGVAVIGAVTLRGVLSALRRPTFSPPGR